MITGLTVREIAERHGRTDRQVEWWIQSYDWPAPVTRRGKALFYDQAETDAAVRKILALGDPAADPDELLDVRQAAEEAGLSYGTVRADISRGRWPAPDDESGGKRWRRSTIREAMAARKPDKRRRARAERDGKD